MAPPKEHIRANIQYTVIVRLPFPRRDFHEPPQVQWDATKDKKLWKLIARNPKSASGDLDWAARAAEFGVDTPFLLQQAAWLYERHFKHVKEQMTRIRASSTTSTPIPGLSGMSVVGAKKLPGPASRAPSSLSIRSQKENPIPRGDTSNPGTPKIPTMPPLSRTPSTNTVTQSRIFLQPSASQRLLRPSAHAATRKSDSPVIHENDEQNTTKSSPISSTSDSTTSSDSAPENITRSQLFRRPPRFGVKRPALANVDDDEEDEDDDEPAFLSAVQTIHERKTPSNQPTDRTSERSTMSRDKKSTQRHSRSNDVTEDPRTREARAVSPKGKGKARANLQTVDSSTGSLSSPGSHTKPSHAQQQRRGIDTLSPRHRAELTRLGSPRRTGTATAAGESDGTPSMGSSFSDLDDTSISQSALEEALASNLRHGGASRLSTLSHAFRSRYT